MTFQKIVTNRVCPYKGLLSVLTSILIRHSGYAPESLTSQNEAQIKAQICRALVQQESLDLVLPAFPYKSINHRDKVAGADPDAGEYAALKTLSSLCAELNRYIPTKLFIVSDGHVFNDLDDLPDETVDSYFSQLEGLNSSSSIRFLRLYDFLGPGSIAFHRNQLMRDFAQSAAELGHRLATVESDLSLYRGLKRFIMEEQTRLPGESRGAFERRCGHLAKACFQRSDAYSQMLARKMPAAIRLSIHPRSDWSEKIPIRLVPSTDRWATPWHNVAVILKNGTMTLMHKKEALRKGYKPEYREGKIWQYTHYT